MAKKKIEKAVTKTDAVKRALAALGADAKGPAILEHVKKEHGLTISPAYLSWIKSTLKSKLKKGGRPKKATAAPEVAAANTAVTKTEAVKQALAQLSNDARGTDIVAFVKQEFGLTVSSALVSNIRNPFKRTDAAVASTTVAQASRNGKANGVTTVSLDDLELVKTLARTYGATGLMRLVGVVS